MGDKGIKETTELLAAAISLGNSIGLALEDGKISVGDLPAFLSPVLKLPAALAGIDEVPSEMADLSQEEREELYAYVRDNFDIPTDKIEVAIEEGIALASQIHNYITKVVLA